MTSKAESLYRKIIDPAILQETREAHREVLQNIIAPQVTSGRIITPSHLEAIQAAEGGMILDDVVKLPLNDVTTRDSGGCSAAVNSLPTCCRARSAH